MREITSAAAAASIAAPVAAPAPVDGLARVFADFTEAEDPELTFCELLFEDALEEFFPPSFSTMPEDSLLLSELSVSEELSASEDSSACEDESVSDELSACEEESVSD